MRPGCSSPWLPVAARPLLDSAAAVAPRLSIDPVGIYWTNAPLGKALQQTVELLESIRISVKLARLALVVPLIQDGQPFGLAMDPANFATQDFPASVFSHEFSAGIVGEFPRAVRVALEDARNQLTLGLRRSGLTLSRWDFWPAGRSRCRRHPMACPARAPMPPTDLLTALQQQSW
jgi:hypothetical protein